MLLFLLLPCFFLFTYVVYNINYVLYSRTHTHSHTQRHLVRKSERAREYDKIVSVRNSVSPVEMYYNIEEHHIAYKHKLLTYAIYGFHVKYFTIKNTTKYTHTHTQIHIIYYIAWKNGYEKPHHIIHTEIFILQLQTKPHRHTKPIIKLIPS